MEAIREICNPQSEDLVIKLPRKFIKKTLEVIVLPFDKKSREKKSTKKERLVKIYNESKGILPEGFKFDRDELHER